MQAVLKRIRYIVCTALESYAINEAKLLFLYEINLR